MSLFLFPASVADAFLLFFPSPFLLSRSAGSRFSARTRILCSVRKERRNSQKITDRKKTKNRLRFRLARSE